MPLEVNGSQGKVSGLACHFVLAIFAMSPVAQGQFTSTAAGPPPAPVSQAFTDGFMEGHRTMAMNLGSGKIAGPARANTGKGELADTSQELRDLADFVGTNWDKADDGGRGKVAGEIEVTIQSDQLYAQELAKNVGVDIPNHSTESGYFSAPGHLNGDKAHAVKLLTDTAAELESINAAIRGDKQKSKTGEFVDNHAIVDVLPGGANVRLARRDAQTKASAPIRSNNFLADSIRKTSDNLVAILMPSATAEPAK